MMGDTWAAIGSDERIKTWGYLEQHRPCHRKVHNSGSNVSFAASTRFRKCFLVCIIIIRTVLPSEETPDC